MNNIQLSICMPTYNFGKFIGEALKSIIEQIVEGVEIIVVDGASTDNTQEIVSGYMQACPVLKYIRMPQKGGIDFDMAHTVSHAEGEYCWLFSSDDIMKENSLSRILNEIKSGYDIYICEFTTCSLDMCKKTDLQSCLNSSSEIVLDLSNKEERFLYFKKSISTNAFFSYMSNIIVKKAKWDSVKNNESYYGTCWAHAARIFSMISNGLKIKYLPEAYLLKRSDNDSFLVQGMIHRCGLAVYGYQHIANAFFGEMSWEAFHIRRTLRHEFGLRFLYSLKCEASSFEGQIKFEKLVNQLYIDPIVSNRLRMLALKYMPISIYKILQPLYKYLCGFFLWCRRAI